MSASTNTAPDAMQNLREAGCIMEQVGAILDVVVLYLDEREKNVDRGPILAIYGAISLCAAAQEKTSSAEVSLLKEQVPA